MENQYPLVSIILPIRNEATYIERTLQAIANQNYPAASLEVIIIDGQSTDHTLSIAENFCRTQLSLRSQILSNPRRIFSTGFNVGLAKASGDVIIFMGGHSIMAQDYVTRCVDSLENYPDFDSVGGPIETIAETPSSKAIALAMSSYFGVGGVTFRTKADTQQEVDTVAFAAYKRKVFERCGPLDEEMVRNQDDEFNYRLRELGGKILFVPTIHSSYYSRTTILGLWKQYFQYGFWKVRVMQKHPSQMRVRHFIPPLFVASEIVALLLTMFTSWGWLTLLGIIGLYYFVNLLISFYLSQKNGWDHFPKLIQVFTVLHNSYGIGFLIGLFRFWNRWQDRSIHAVDPYGTQVQVNDQIYEQRA